MSPSLWIRLALLTAGFCAFFRPSTASTSLLGGRVDELAEALLQLSSERAHLRERAERYLAGHATVADFPRLAEMASDGDAEVTTRLARAIGASDENLGLAAMFMGQSVPELREVGEQAVSRRIAEWNERLSATCLTGSDLQKRLFDVSQASYPHIVRLNFAGSLAEQCGAMLREVDLPLGLTISTQLFNREPVRELGAYEGDWPSALMVLARMYGVGLELHGLARRERENEELQGPKGAFLRFSPLSELGARTGQQHVLEWFRTVATSDDINARRRATHNLARTGWPGALTWMQERAVIDEDALALEGLVVAAAHGRRASVLLRPGVLTFLLEEAEERLARSSPTVFEDVERLLAAYREAGCLTPGEASLSEALFSSWETRSPASKALRLALLESLGCADLEGLALARAVAGEEREPAMLRWQALSTANRVASIRGVETEPPDWPEPERMLEGLTEARAIAEGVRLLVDAGIVPQARWAEPEQRLVTRTNGWRAALMLWWMGSNQYEVAGLYLSELLDADASRLVVAALENFGPVEDRELDAIFDAARRGVQEAALSYELDRAEVLLGRLSPAGFLTGLSGEERQEYLDAQDYPLHAAMGVWGGTPEAFEARAHLLDQLKQALARGGDARRYGSLALALEALLRGLLERGEDGIATRVREEIAEITVRSAERGLARRLSRGWPPPSRRHLRILGYTPAGARIRALAQAPTPNGR